MPIITTEFLDKPYAAWLICLCICLFAALCCVLAFRLKVIRWAGGEAWFASRFEAPPMLAKQTTKTPPDTT